MSYEHKTLKPRHHRIVDLALSGMSNQQIASEVGLNVVSVGVILRSPLVQAELSRRKVQVENKVHNVLSESVQLGREMVEGAAVEAASTMIGLMESADERVRLSSAKDILDRVYGQDKQQSTTVVVVGGDRLKNLMSAFEEAFEEKLEVKNTVDGTVVHVEDGITTV